MTTDLEKQFFDTFGLGVTESAETRFIPVAPGLVRDSYNGKLLEPLDDDNWRKTFQNNYLKKYPYKGRIYYPQITDRHYLEFVRICCNECPWEFPSDFKNVEELKRFLIYNITQLEYIDRVKQQIIELFKE